MAQKISNSERYPLSNQSHISNDDFYACKVIKRPQNQNNDLFSNIARECEILSKLEHPNMIKLHAALKTQNNLYLITDYCDQGDLTTFVSKLYAQQNQNSKGEQCGTKLIENQGRDLLNSKSRVSENEARYILNQILQGLSYLHDQCVVHRDIKMDNILVKRKKYHQFIVPQNVNKNIECNNMYDKVNQGLKTTKIYVQNNITLTYIGITGMLIQKTNLISVNEQKIINKFIHCSIQKLYFNCIIICNKYLFKF